MKILKSVIIKGLSLINVHPDKNQAWLLICCAISTLLITYIHPTIVKVTISALPAQWIAFQSLASSISGLLIGILWKGKIRKYAIKWFFWLASTESLCGLLLGLYLCFIEWNVWIFAVTSLIYSSLVSIFVGKCMMAFKSKLWIEKEREIYDNNSSIIMGFVCIIGYLIAIFNLPPLKLAIFIWSLCCVIDDIGWIIVYLKNKEFLKKEAPE